MTEVNSLYVVLSDDNLHTDTTAERGLQQSQLAQYLSRLLQCSLFYTCSVWSGREENFWYDLLVTPKTEVLASNNAQLVLGVTEAACMVILKILLSL